MKGVLSALASRGAEYWQNTTCGQRNQTLRLRHRSPALITELRAIPIRGPTGHAAIALVCATGQAVEPTLIRAGNCSPARSALERVAPPTAAFTLPKPWVQYLHQPEHARALRISPPHLEAGERGTRYPKHLCGFFLGQACALPIRLPIVSQFNHCNSLQRFSCGLMR